MFGCPRARGRDLLIGVRSVISEAGRRRAPMCYTKKDRELGEEARWITESRLRKRKPATAKRTTTGVESNRRSP
jgi:hypothetical protein